MSSLKYCKLKYWEIVDDKLHAAGWSWGYCSAVNATGRRWIVDAHKGDGKRYIIQSDKLLSAFLEDFRIAGTRSALVKRAGCNQQRGRLRDVLQSVA